MAQRKNVANIRMEDHTNDPDPAKLLNARKQAAPGGPAKAPMSQLKPAPMLRSALQSASR
jgi:hypothetical protein